MAKKETKTDDAAPSFEASLGKLEQIVLQLEQGDIGLADAMTRYEEGVKLLGSCYKQLEQAEARIELLSGVDAEGNPVTAPFDDEEGGSLDEKATSRSRRRTAKKSKKAKKSAANEDTDDVDTSGSLF